MKNMHDLKNQAIAAKTPSFRNTATAFCSGVLITLTALAIAHTIANQSKLSAPLQKAKKIAETPEFTSGKHIVSKAIDAEARLAMRMKNTPKPPKEKLDISYLKYFTDEGIINFAISIVDMDEKTQKALAEALSEPENEEIFKKLAKKSQQLLAIAEDNSVKSSEHPLYADIFMGKIKEAKYDMKGQVLVNGMIHATLALASEYEIEETKANIDSAKLQKISNNR
jgi:hypothetical protein